MTVSDFVRPFDFEDMRKSVQGREVFGFEKRFPVNGSEIKIQIDGRTIDKELADSVWHGNDYLVGFSENHTGKFGWGGFGFATEKLDMFDSWENFKGWFDKAMRSLPEYEEEEFGQIALF